MTTKEGWHHSKELQVTEIFMRVDDWHGKGSPPSVNCCFFKRRKINPLTSVQISRLLLIFFLPTPNTTLTLQELALHIKGHFPVFPPLTRVGWQALFPLPWSPEAARGEEKRRRKAFGWAAGPAFSIPCVDPEFVVPSCALYDLLNILRFAIKSALWDLKCQ